MPLIAALNDEFIFKMLDRVFEKKGVKETFYHNETGF